LNKNIVFICYVFDLIFFWMFNNQNNQITIKSLFDFLNFLISKKFDILRSNVRVYIKLCNLILFDKLFSPDGRFGLLPAKIKQISSLFGWFSFN